jgi:hypothetical protein
MMDQLLDGSVRDAGRKVSLLHTGSQLEDSAIDWLRFDTLLASLKPKEHS